MHGLVFLDKLKDMKELRDITRAFEKASLAGKKCALATVVQVIGSSYRRPGARMLVTDDGQLTGAISGGCLEGDALRKAMLAISEGKNKIVTYDTTDEDDAKFGVQLGCNGIVHILFEPIDIKVVNHPISLLQQLLAERGDAVLATLFSVMIKEPQHGTVLLYSNKQLVLNGALTLTEKEIDTVAIDANSAFSNQSSSLKTYLFGQEVAAFMEYIKPTISLIIAGAGNDAIPLVDIAHTLGWQITVLDGRATHATTQRFPKANKVLIAKPEVVPAVVSVDDRTAFVLMTHNYNYDMALLKYLLPTNAVYIGMLGPKSKMQRMYDELTNEGIQVTELQKENIYSPVGLDIGAETAEEIALSIVAEIKAAMSAKNAQMLRMKKLPIHV